MAEPTQDTNTKQDSGVKNFTLGVFHLAIGIVMIVTANKLFLLEPTLYTGTAITVSALFGGLMLAFGIRNVCLCAIKSAKQQGIL